MYVLFPAIDSERASRAEPQGKNHRTHTYRYTPSGGQIYKYSQRRQEHNRENKNVYGPQNITYYVISVLPVVKRESSETETKKTRKLIKYPFCVTTLAYIIIIPFLSDTNHTSIVSCNP